MYKLLIVDDEPNIIKGIQCSLDWEAYGFGLIFSATDYQDAVKIAIETNPELAILDVCLGHTRGYDIINDLKEFQLKTAFIMISGYGEFEYAREAIRCGARDYLLKPVDRTQLEELVKKIVVRDLHGSVELTASPDRDVDPVLLVRYDSLSTMIRRVLQIVRVGYGQNINLKIVADKFKMNSTYLGQIFLKETHIKFSEYLMSYRMIKAKELIQTTGDKIVVVALAVGYTNLNYFYQHFRSYFNVSPTDLRQ